jgi:hypothetical protein
MTGMLVDKAVVFDIDSCAYFAEMVGTLGVGIGVVEQNQVTN